MNQIIQYPGDANRQFEKFRYPGGEVQVRLKPEYAASLKNPAVEKVTIVARIIDGDIIPVAQLINAVRSATSADIELVLPYLPYSRADRRFSIGDCNGLQVFGQILNTFAGVEIITLDAHSPLVAAGFIRHFTNIRPRPIIEHVLDRIDGSGIYGNPVIAAGVLLPDKGALRYGYKTTLIAEKKRDPETGKLSGFVVPSKLDVEGLDAILIIDDICDGGGTFIGIAEALRKAGITQDLFLYVTHGIFSKNLSGLKQYFKHVYTTDSFGVAESYGEPEFLTVLPCLPTILGEHK